MERSRGVAFYKPVVRDIAKYSNPIIALHVGKGPRVLLRYIRGLARMGFWRSPLFFVYCLLLISLGQRRVDGLIEFLKRRVGHTPVIGRVYTGESGR